MFKITYITAADQAAAARRLGVSIDAVRAVTAIEARGSGFIKGTDLPVILFEGHQFHKRTGGRWSKTTAHRDISYPTWTKEHYVGGEGEYRRLARAVKLDQVAALESASVGMFQIMGFNHRHAGFATVQDFWNDQALGEGQQLAAFVGFLLADDGMLQALRSNDWADFARRYNGPGYKKNRYDTLLAAEFARQRKLRDDAPLRGDIAAVQAALNVELDAGLSVDGWMGPRTASAITDYQAQAGLPLTGQPDDATRAALGVFEPEKEAA